MIVEHYTKPDATAVYERFRERGRMIPPGLRYLKSWVDVDAGQCFQLMETEDRALLDEWMARWSDIVDFEVHEVVTSDEAERLPRR